MPAFVRYLLALCLVGGLTVGLNACGVKGPLQPPPGEVNEVAPQDQSGRKPHRPFILDGIL